MPQTDPSPVQASSIFSSKRERRLWIWTLVLVVGIYATLGLASSLAPLMYNQGVSAILFLTCMLLIAITILTQGLTTRPKGFEVGVAMGIGVVYFLVIFRLTIPERSHLMEYGVVAVFIFEALMERKRNGRVVPFAAVLAILATSAIGAVDEFIQAILPNREFEWTDMLFNFLAALMATIAMVVLRWARHRGDRGNA